MEYTAENLENAVGLFYRSEAGQQVDAHKWLTEAQHSPQAWSFVWELLEPHRSSEVQFFAATTLHTKILKYWNEVPENQYDVLKKKILDTIVAFAMGPKIVLNRLCITLSAYIIHTVPVHWPKAFEELVGGFQPQYLPNVEPERVIWILLDILTVIPEEFQSTVLAISQRSRVRTVLQEVSKDILKVVEMCFLPIPNVGFDIANLTTYLHSARCASAWIELGGVNIDECSHIIDLMVDLICFVYWRRNDVDGFNSEEMELIEFNIEALTAIVQHPNTHKYRTYIMKHTANMLEKFNKILENEKTSPEPNKEIMTPIYLLLESIADNHCKIFLQNLRSNNSEDCKITNELFTCILQCTNLPGFYPVDETSSTITFSFWYTLQDDILSLDPSECAELLLLVKPYYRQLVCVMLRKSMLQNEDESSSWTLEDKEMFRCYRQDIADTFMYCYGILNIEMLDILTNQLETVLRKCSESPRDWNSVECCLHAFSSVAECIELENFYLPKLMLILKDIPYNSLNYKVLSASLDCVGAYSEWLAEHPELLENVVPLVVSGLGNPKVTPSATMALKDLTHNCQKFLMPYSNHILLACQAGLNDGNLKLAECLRIMHSVGKVLSILSINNIMEYLKVLLSPSFDEIQNLLNSEPNSSVTTGLITRLKMLSALFGSLHVQIPPNSNIQQPLLLIVQNTMPLYMLIANKYSNNTDVIDVLCNLLKYALTTLMDDSKPLINDIIELLVQVHRQTPQPSVLALINTILIMFGKEECNKTVINNLLREIVNTNLELISQLSVSNQLAEKSDLIEGFFAMLAQVNKKIPIILVSCGIDLAALFQCAILCLSLSESQTIKMCSSFLVSFISISRDTSQASIVQMFGESLVMRILHSLAGNTPRSSVEVLSDVILVLNKKYCDNLSRWLHTLLQQDGFPSPRVTVQQKEQFIKTVLREKVNKKKLADTVIEFMLICRGILKMENSI